MLITEPIAIAAVIPSAPPMPIALRSIEAARSVAIVIPETGLLLLPTSPTIRDETAAKKKPNTTVISAPTNVTEITGISHSASVRTATAAITKRRSSSRSVRFVLFPLRPTPESAARNVPKISGSERIRLISPPAASAPAPM